ncbi:hypothetical protein S83_036226, partial [Arachis hypogaea]
LLFFLGNSFITRISNGLRVGSPREARVAVVAVITLAGSQALLVSSIIFGCQNILSYIFVYEQDVLDFVTDIAPLICDSIILYTLQGNKGKKKVSTCIVYTITRGNLHNARSNQLSSKAIKAREMNTRVNHGGHVVESGVPPFCILLVEVGLASSIRTRAFRTKHFMSLLQGLVSSIRTKRSTTISHLMVKVSTCVVYVITIGNLHNVRSFKCIGSWKSRRGMSGGRSCHDSCRLTALLKLGTYVNLGAYYVLEISFVAILDFW